MWCLLSESLTARCLGPECAKCVLSVC
uniref:Uncharacterized protein n=1 Tax=Anguilla anguilla TaxID=7936 RepID=A0A0E9TRM4_ANGAN